MLQSLKHCLFFRATLGQALLTRSCHEDVTLTRMSHNCAWTAFVQGESAGGSKLIEQTLPTSRAQIAPMATRGIIIGRDSWGWGQMASKRDGRMAWLGGGGKR